MKKSHVLAAGRKEKVIVTDEERKEAVRLIASGEKTRREVAVAFNVSLPTVHLWMAKVRGGTRSTLKDKIVHPAGTPGDDTVSIRRRIKLLEIELDYLRRKLAVLEGEYGG